MEDDKLLFREECYAIQGAIFDVYKNLGNGFLEAVYQEALGLEFEHRKIPFVAQPSIEIFYKGNQLAQTYRPDFFCYEKIIVELKTVSEVTDVHRAQVLNYLKATRARVGLLVNFNAFPGAEIHRLCL